MELSALKPFKQVLVSRVQTLVALFRRPIGILIVNETIHAQSRDVIDRLRVLKSWHFDLDLCRYLWFSRIGARLFH